MIKVEEYVILAPFTTFHIGGPADHFVVVSSTSELIEAIEWAHSAGSGQARGKSMPFFVLGTGANILVGDKGFRGLVIKNNANNFQIPHSAGSAQDNSNKTVILGKSPQATDSRIKEGSWSSQDDIFLTSESGTTIAELIEFSLEKGLSGLEHFAGIPSSVGGALWQNLHFLSPDRSSTVFISEILESAELIKIDNNVILGRSENDDSRINSSKSSDNKTDSGRTSFARMTVKRDYFNFSYDYSSLHDTHDIVLSATFRLTPEDKNIIQERIDANLKWRAEKHPENATKCSAGSIFRKIEGFGAGRLIEKVGLKGKKIGGAQISERHANFIINTDAATAKDVRELIFLAQEKVKNELDLDLQPEISFVGEF